jgi:hypothetical protein
MNNIMTIFKRKPKVKTRRLRFKNATIREHLHELRAAGAVPGGAGRPAAAAGVHAQAGTVLRPWEPRDVFGRWRLSVVRAMLAEDMGVFIKRQGDLPPLANDDGSARK